MTAPAASATERLEASLKRIAANAFEGSVIFTKLYVEDHEIVDHLLAEPFDAFEPLHMPVFQRASPAKRTKGAPKGASRSYMSSAALLSLALRDEGLSKAALVEVAGIEPASFGTEPGLLRVQPASGLLGPDSHAGELSPGPVAVRCSSRPRDRGVR